MVDHALATKQFSQRLGKLTARSKTPVYLDHVSSAALGFATALVLRHIRQTDPERRIWVVARDLRTQENVGHDLLTWFGSTVFFPEQEQDKSIDGLPDQDVQAERLAILQRLHGAEPMVLIANASSLDEEVPLPSGLHQEHISFRKGAEIRLAEIIATLEKADYERTSQVAERGQFAVRGGIVDIFSWHAELPVRMELFDQEIESIRSFDPDSQMSISRLNETAVLLSPGLSGQTCALRECIGSRDLVVAVELPDLLTAGVHILQGAAPSKPGKAEEFATACHDHPLGDFHAGDFVLQEVRRTEFSKQVERWQADGWRMEMFFNTEGEMQRFQELVPAEAKWIHGQIGALHRGFVVPAAKLVVLCDAEIFGRYQTTRARRLFGQDRQAKARRAPLDLSEMQLGDLVVHLEHGLGNIVDSFPRPVTTAWKKTC